ncbi:hypothetical protein NDU88_000826 [Pleurodeles waltl]|uniref:Uncharacterized protein n=1 Tax=Pleurodeles waltl TaxID=8319 RepID=A0AAV7ND25_PLEWA|nr:hypothetical protein NDU88_000826 [Pleurodeles waltl]
MLSHRMGLRRGERYWAPGWPQVGRELRDLQGPRCMLSRATPVYRGRVIAGRPPSLPVVAYQFQQVLGTGVADCSRQSGVAPQVSDADTRNTVDTEMMQN